MPVSARSEKAYSPLGSPATWVFGTRAASHKASIKTSWRSPATITRFGYLEERHFLRSGGRFAPFVADAR